jgi:hypothetical protein
MDVIDEAVRRALVVRAQVVVGGKGATGDAVLADNVLAAAVAIGKEAPAGFLEKLVDGDPGLGFGGHEAISYFAGNCG